VWSWWWRSAAYGLSRVEFNCSAAVAVSTMSRGFTFFRIE
jgi:hypothetical protein